MIIKIFKNTTVEELQHAFSQAYPYLKVDIFKDVNGRLGTPVKQKLGRNAGLSAAGKLKEGSLEIYDSMTVGQLEKMFREHVGITAQISRKSGPVWLETTVTDNWTLQQQNEHGRELSAPVKRVIPEDREDWDQ